MEELVIRINGKEYNVTIEETEEGKIKVYCGKDVYEVETKSGIKQTATEVQKKHLLTRQDKAAVTAPLPGIITEVNIKKGQKVKKGQLLLKLIAMKMENDITAPKDGKIKEVKVKKNANVSRGDVLAVIE